MYIESMNKSKVKRWWVSFVRSFNKINMYTTGYFDYFYSSNVY